MQVILETMRLASVVSGVMRRTANDVELNGICFQISVNCSDIEIFIEVMTLTMAITF